MSAIPFEQDTAAEAQIRAIVAEQVVAWDAGDGAAYAKDLAPDASFTNLFGMVMYGAAAFTERHHRIHCRYNRYLDHSLHFYPLRNVANKAYIGLWGFFIVMKMFDV